MKNTDYIDINLDYIEKDLVLTIDEKTKGTLFVSDDYEEHLETEYQIKESFSYDYKFSSSDYSLLECEYCSSHKRERNIGVLSPNIYVGTLKLPVLKKDSSSEKFVPTDKHVSLEVQSLKADYRSDYKDMLEYITEQCTELLLQTDSPVYQNLEIDFDKDRKSLYQQFSFIKSILMTDEFSEAIHRILTAPVTLWKEEAEEKDIRGIRKLRQNHLKLFTSAASRTHVPVGHPLRKSGLSSIPQRINDIRKTDSVDTYENRFIKYALETFLKFTEDIHTASLQNNYDILKKESAVLKDNLEIWLQHSIFKEISRPSTLKLNSPVLQRKEGYREVLRVWLMFDLAAKLIWSGGEDVYDAGKKNIAVLYEYWVFFKLVNLFNKMFKIPAKSISELIQKTADGLNLTLKQGRHKVLSGVYETDGRKLEVRFHYNKSFSGKNGYPSAGSWTTTMRPDYTLSIWPYGVNESEAENEESIVHIHFDAKYKIANLTDLLEDNKDLNSEKKENRKGIYKNADLLKMHAYKDAIRRTGGAYVLYPGDHLNKKQGFHEVIPGLGAFPVKPSKTEDGISELRAFIIEVVRHFCNRASQRERLAYRNYEIYNDEIWELREPSPEPYGEKRGLIPADTHILVAYYRKENWDWIVDSGLYNTRAGNDRGSLRLGPGESGAKYILLHTSDELMTSKLLKVTETGPRIFSKEQIKGKGYVNPSQSFYLVYKVTDEVEVEFKQLTWDIRKLKGYREGRGSALPFSVTLTELMKSIIQTK